MNVTLRQQIEREIADAFLTQVLADNYAITVNDGDEDAVVHSSDKDAILAAMFAVDECTLFLFESFGATSDEGADGWVTFIFGNDGWDVISDYTVNLQHLMTEADKVSKRYQP